MKTWSVLGLVLLVACAESEPSPTVNAGGSTRDASTCLDADEDGFGEGCALGGDCNDNDPAIHIGCLGCVRPAEGCACDNTHKPISCYLEPTEDERGAMCHEGTRYCRDGEWSACESIFSYPKPAVAQQPQAIVNPDAGLEKCNECRPNCFVVRDNLNPVDGGVGGSGNQTQIGDGGGLSLGTYIVDSGPPADAGPAYDAAACMVGSAPDKDCDGILDLYDPYPTTKPFATANPAIFMDLAKGETETGAINLAFYLNSADVYFLVDQTGSMDGERDRIVADLTTGDFVNNAKYNCSDYDFDTLPNNELKTRGIIGGIRCYIRDANFGVGFFREIPFNITSKGYYAYGDNNEIAFRNLSDITGDVTKVTNNVAKLDVDLNIDWEEATMPALYSLVTGNGMYFGTTKPSVPTRGGCPAGTWGYPCFRNDAIPIVVLFTDAPTHNGPSNNSLPYDTSLLPITRNTDGAVTMASGNETFGSAIDVGDVTNKYVTFSGDTTGMASNYGAGSFSCNASGAKAPDAFFKFTLDSTKSVTITTDASEYDTMLGLWRGAPTGVSTLPSFPNTNDTVSAPYNFTDVTNRFVQASGSTASLQSDYLAADLGCGAYSGSADAAFTFSVSQSSVVALDTSGSSIGTSIALFNGAPVLPSYNASPINTNDSFASPHAIGAINNQLKSLYGTTNAKGITPDYTAVQVGCGTDSASPDAVYTFELTGGGTRKVRITAEDSALDTVLALADNGGDTIVQTATYTNNDSMGINPAILGDMASKAWRITGSTSSLSASTYSSAVVGCNPASSYDAVYSFSLSEPRTVSIDTIGSTVFDTLISLHKDSIASADTAVTGTSAYTNLATAYNLGSANSKRYVVSGSTTAAMVADYTNTQTGSCSAASASASPDAVYRFQLDTPTRVRLDTVGSGFDTVLSLHDSLPDAVVTNIGTGTGDTVASPYAIGNASDQHRRFDSAGGTTSFAANVSVMNADLSCLAHDQAPDAVLSFTVTKSGSYEIDTSGSAFDTVLGLYSSADGVNQLPTPSAIGGQGETKGAAVAVGTIDGTWKTYTGSTGSMADNNEFQSCGAHRNARDAYYRFSVGPGGRTVAIDTVPIGFTAFDSVIGLFNDATDAQITCNDGGFSPGDAITGFLPQGTYYVVVKGKVTGSGGSGSYRMSIRDMGANPILACDDDAGSGDSSMIVANLTAGVTYYAVVKGKAAAEKGAFKLAVRDVSWFDAGGVRSCNDNTSGTDSAIETDLAAGDYWVVVKGKSNAPSGYGTYKLTVQDVSAAPTGFMECNTDSTPGVYSSSITRALPAGDYWVVVKAANGASPTRGAYKFNIRDVSTTPTTVLACDHSTGPGGTSAIETNLAAPGTYRVIVKGKTAATGAYKLQVRDVTGLPVGTNRLACDHASGSGSKSYLEYALDAGTYTVVMKGDSASNGAYKLSVRDATNLAAGEANAFCNLDSGSGNAAKITQTLSAGTYYVGVKGQQGSGNAGVYQVHMGGGATTAGTYQPPSWATTLAALKAKKVRVIPILSCYDDWEHGDAQGDCKVARTQFTALANATDTLGSNLQPLVYDIHSSGSGLSGSVVKAVASLAQYLEMNVSVQIVFDPDTNPGFQFTVKAIDVPGDGCDGLVGAEHQKCAPGASPKFEVSFTNPLNAPVPRNSLAKDPNGGYNFRAELIANNTWVVDRVPIYIIPENVTMPGPPPPKVHASGTYTQNLAGTGCAAKTDLPDWNELTWRADIPFGTSVSFSACGGDSATALAACTPAPLATITGGSVCNVLLPCPSGAFCSSGGNCLRITGTACTTNASCKGGSTCDSGTCVFSGQPIDVGELLGMSNYKPNMRVQIGLAANTTANIGPTVHDWSLNYLCKSSL
jgi:hypothetical protein